MLATVLVVLVFVSSGRAQRLGRRPVQSIRRVAKAPSDAVLDPSIPLWIILLRQEPVQAHLRLTESQKAAIHEVGATCVVKMREDVAAWEDIQKLNTAERQAKLLERRKKIEVQTEALQKTLGTNLLPSQVNRLKQIICQVRGIHVFLTGYARVLGVLARSDQAPL